MRQALPLSFSSDGRQLLVASTAPGTQQLFAVPVEGGEMQQLTDYDEPVSGQFLPDGRLLVEIDAGGNERTQLYVDGEPLVSTRGTSTTRRTRPGTFLAYATNRRNGIDFDVVVRDLASGEERTFEIGGWVGGRGDLRGRAARRRRAPRRPQRRLGSLPLRRRRAARSSI